MKEEGQDMDDILEKFNLPTLESLLRGQLLRATRKRLKEKGTMGDFAIRGRMDFEEELKELGRTQKTISTAMDKKLSILLLDIAESMEDEAAELEEDGKSEKLWEWKDEEEKQHSFTYAQMADIMRVGHFENSEIEQGTNNEGTITSKITWIEALCAPEYIFKRISGMILESLRYT